MSTSWSFFQVMELEESNLPLIVERCAYVYQAPDDRCGDHPQAWWPSPGWVTIPRLIICGASPSSSPLYCGDCSDVISPGIYWRGWGSGPCCHCCIIHHQPCSPSHFSSLSPHRHHCLTVTTVTTLSEVSLTTLCHWSVWGDVSLWLPCMTQTLHGEISLKTRQPKLQITRQLLLGRHRHRPYPPDFHAYCSQFLLLGNYPHLNLKQFLVIKYSSHSACIISAKSRV